MTISNDTSIVYWHLSVPIGVMSVEKALTRLGNERSHCALTELNENKAPLTRKKESKNFFIVENLIVNNMNTGYSGMDTARHRK